MNLNELPQAQDAEQAVLGAMLLDPAAVRDVRLRLTAGDFFREGHRRLFEAVTDLADSGGAVDPVTLVARLETNGTLAAAGGREYVGWLMDLVPTAANATHHADLVRRTASQRRVHATLTQGAGDALVRGADPAAIAADIVQQLVGEASVGSKSRGFVALKDVLWDAMETIERRALGERAGLISVGLPELDNAPVYGVEAGDLVTLLLVSGHGKTALQLSLSRFAAEAGTVVGIVSAEMLARQLVNRLLSSYTGIPYGRLRSGDLTDDEFPRLARAAAQLASLPIHIDDSSTPHLRDVLVRVRALKAMHPTLEIVHVDYAQLLSADGETRALQIETIANGLKGLAKELGIVVVQSAQPDGKGVDRRSSDDPMPHTADVAWGQGLRNASDLFVCGYRPGKYDPSITDNEMRCLVRKSRASGEEAFALHWHGPAMLAWSARQRDPWAGIGRAA